MQMRKLGRTNIKVSAIGFGGIPIQRVEESEAIRIIKRAVDLGINFFDTSNDVTYGDSESKIGRAIHDNRENLVIATKTKKKTAEGVTASINSSLSRLKTDYIDLYMFHNVNNLADIESPSIVEVIQKDLASGKIRFLGISSHKWEVIDKAIKSGIYDVVEYIFNPVKRRATYLIEEANKRDIGFIAMKPLAGGNILRADLSLRWILGYSVSTAIPGSETMEHLKQNASVGNKYKPLSETEMMELRKDTKNLEGILCLSCGYCMPCEQKVQVPTILYLYNYATKMGMKEQALARFRREVKVNPYFCTDCGDCETRCPEEVLVRERLKIAADYFREKLGSKAFEAIWSKSKW